MSSSPMRPVVLVAGTASPFDGLARRAARMVGWTLAEHGFNLLTGNAPCVDKSVAKSFCLEVLRRGEARKGRYQQLRLSWPFRGSLWPGPQYEAPAEMCAEVVPLKRMHEWLAEARWRADAAVIIGGRRGTQRTADRFMDAGKPVFPVPFTGGCSNDVFREILRTWCDNPVPGLTKSQFLRLAVPWVAGTGALADLLLGTLAPTPDIFISYRRTDAWMVGRLQHDLAEHFGTKRVFMDLDDIGASQDWTDVIDSAVGASRVGIVVIGKDWLSNDASGSPRLLKEEDVCRREVLGLLGDKARTIVVVLTPDAPTPESWSLPREFERLSKTQAVTISPANWDMVLTQIIRVIGPALRARGRDAAEPPPAAEPPAPVAGAEVQ